MQSLRVLLHSSKIIFDLILHPVLYQAYWQPHLQHECQRHSNRGQNLLDSPEPNCIALFCRVMQCAHNMDSELLAMPTASIHAATLQADTPTVL